MSTKLNLNEVNKHIDMEKIKKRKSTFVCFYTRKKTSLIIKQ